MTHRVLFAGFGGQGVMLMGELLSYAAMIDGKQVTYMPSYGPEMRGGTANCSVIVSDEPIASPIITKSSVLVAMNEPSLDKFEGEIEQAGFLFTNKALVNRYPERSDIHSFSIDCNTLAQEILNEKIANIVMLGAVIHASKIVSLDAIDRALETKFTGRKEKFIPLNQRALRIWQNEGQV